MREKPRHPGDLFNEVYIVEGKFSENFVAKCLGISVEELEDFLEGKTKCDSDFATKIGKATKTDAKRWLDMQNDLDLWQAEQKEIEVAPLQN